MRKTFVIYFEQATMSRAPTLLGRAEQCVPSF